MNKINSWMAILLGLFGCSSFQFMRSPSSVVEDELFKDGLTQTEVEERHRIILQNKPNEEKRFCNGFAYNDEFIYTAQHCLQHGNFRLENGTDLEEVVSTREGDVSLLSPKLSLSQYASANSADSTTMEYQLAEYFTNNGNSNNRNLLSRNHLSPVPLYQRELKNGEEVTFFVKVDKKKLEEFIVEYPEQAHVTDKGLLRVSGNITGQYNSESMLDTSCRLYRTENMYVVAAPGRLGFSGSPVFVEREGKYLLAGILVAVGMKGRSHCQSPPADKDTIVFSGINNLFSLEVKMAQDYPIR